MSSPEEFEADFAAMGPAYFKHLTTDLKSYGDDFVYDTIWGKLDGDPLTGRSQSLRNSFFCEDDGTTLDNWSMVIYSTSKYAPIQEFGGTIVPKTSKWLAIPLTAAKTPAGVPRGSPRSFKDTFFKTSKKGNLILFQKVGKEKIVPLFVMKKRVDLDPKFGLFDAWDAEKPERSRIIDDAFEAASLEEGGKRG